MLHLLFALLKNASYSHKHHAEFSQQSLCFAKADSWLISFMSEWHLPQDLAEKLSIALHFYFVIPESLLG